MQVVLLLEVNTLQLESLEELLLKAHGSMDIDVVVTKDKQESCYEADWLKDAILEKQR